MAEPAAQRHGGDVAGLARASGLPVSGVVDASANLNPLGPPDWLDAAFAEGRRRCGRYPDPACGELRETAGRRLGIPSDRLVFGNGADELMFALARALASPRAGAAPPVHIVEDPAYASYREAASRAGLAVRSLAAAMPRPAPYRAGADQESVEDALARYARALEGAPPGSTLWLGAPNNPTGIPPAGYPDTAIALAERCPDRFVVCDEAFIDFAEGMDSRGAVEAAARLPNLVVIRSMTKFWAVPGLRAGYAASSPELAAALRAELPNWPLNAVAEAFALAAFSDGEADARRDRTRALASSERARMADALGALPGLEVFESLTNYYLVRVDRGAAGRAEALAEALARRGVGARKCRSFPGLGPNWLRLAVRSPAENDAIAAAFRAELAPPASQPGPRAARRAKALMIQGTSSGAGKSLIAAAFCRIFRDEGLDVAPYKAQNMSLNSAVTPDGLELGRAQAVQAAACGLAPDARMNPVLLKPESDSGSQVILLGKPYARREARDYYARRAELETAARAAYDELAAERELIVLEGAGSPAEINLKRYDFVNMKAARHAGARVLIVGDIDRGGVFASFIGHVATFDPEELGLLSGFIVNKFRGDPALLGDAFAMTRERTGYPVLGCVPMLRGLDIPDEDEPVVKAGSRPGAALRLAVPRLPRVSNFTDLDAFACEPDVEVVALSRGDELAGGGFDAVILPGTKSTVADLAWLRASGLADSIAAFAKKGGAVVGICGGYQMLGLSILDPGRVESDEAATPGLGLLSVVTSFAAEKRLSATGARWLPTGRRLAGYEIHHGGTRLAEGGPARPVVESDSGDILGYGSGEVWGSYLHGIFDADDFRRDFLNALRAGKGLAPLPPNPRPSLDAELSRLADAVKASVDMGAIRAELGL